MLIRSGTSVDSEPAGGSCSALKSNQTTKAINIISSFPLKKRQVASSKQQAAGGTRQLGAILTSHLAVGLGWLRRTEGRDGLGGVAACLV